MKKDRGFTLIELLIVVAIIGIIAAIAIPNLLNAIDRGKQKRTMADMRSIGTAAESYAVDFNRYPAGTGADQTIAASVGQANVLEPTYIKKCPQTDGWSNTMYWNSDANGTAYTVRSYAKGGVVDAGTAGVTTNFTDDIIFSVGSFTRYPEGQQK